MGHFEIISDSIGIISDSAVAAAIGMMARTVASLDDSLSLHGAFSMAVTGKYLEFDAKFDADKEDPVKVSTPFLNIYNSPCPPHRF